MVCWRFIYCFAIHDIVGNNDKEFSNYFIRKSHHNPYDIKNMASFVKGLPKINLAFAYNDEGTPENCHLVQPGIWDEDFCATPFSADSSNEVWLWDLPFLGESYLKQVFENEIQPERSSRVGWRNAHA